MSFVVASYNILADAYVRPGYFPSSPPEALAPERRRPALARRIAALGADVVCLQEVEPAALAAIEALLPPGEFAFHFAPKRAGKPDGCAIGVRRASLAVHAVMPHAYDDGGPQRPPSGHVALLAVLEQAGRRFGVATTHVKWDPPDAPALARLGVRQVPQLLAACACVEPRCDTWIVCGDFNAEAGSEVLAELRRGGWIDAYRDHPRMFTSNANRRAKRIDYLFHTPDLTSRPVALPAISDATPLPSTDEPSDHLPIAATFEWT